MARKLLGPPGTGPKQTLEVKNSVATPPWVRRTAAGHRHCSCVQLQCRRAHATVTPRLAPTRFTRNLALQRLAAVDLLIRSTTGFMAPSSVCTRRADEFVTNGISSTRDTASRGLTTIVTPKSQFRIDSSDHGKAPSNIAP
ncbi:auxin transport protein BIG [Dorcoceras hygrometricum]|uniref:Auxin transport protein BIG n=1 Tax=Dorcoceras hygrometricum TaxID=472368 RepID=A0A2Z7AQB3_9LAMI|nr:auxin transport protein BIG [Dorcoceras hygrometricum]